jgi:2-phospho-L-lactate guanylyltransferase
MRGRHLSDLAGPRGRVVAVPVKDLTTAKHRLQGLLSPAERVALAAAMLRDVLGTLSRARAGDIWVVTGDPDATAIAHAFGADVLLEPGNRGHTEAVALAQREARRRGAAAFVTVPGDVPCITAADVRALVPTSRRGPAATFAPSRSGRGTNGVGLTPPAAMPLVFGEPSFANHLSIARRRGLAVRVVRSPGLELDIDGPDDIVMLLEHGAQTESGRLLASWSVGARLASRAGARQPATSLGVSA